MRRFVRVALVLYVALDLTACGSSPAQPSGSTALTAPALASPANGVTIGNASQPVTLTVANVPTTSAATYTFEVATDAAFTAKVATKDAPAGANGSTSVTLDTLAAGRDYFWRARVATGGATGPFSAGSKFTIGAAVTIDAPLPVSPLSGGSTTTRPTLIVTNVSHPGSAGTIVYRFEIAANPGFSPTLVSQTVPEGIGQTSFTPDADLPSGITFYWHAQAFDATNSASSAFSPAQGVVATSTIDLATVNFQRFVNVTNWKVTDQIISVVQDGRTGDMCVNHTKSGIWPTTDFLGDPNTQVEGNQWYFANINGQWYAGAGEWLRPGQICKSGQYTEQIGPDGSWGGPMDTWQPKPGELVGYMVTTPARSWPDFRTLDERSNVVVQPWHDSRFNAASLIRR
ncbi:MAG TPA: hypothetical protein VLT86_17985 [Vicinamibacterales bacterium]|nr:hypothetical protein [Vicinamibacterales bacterium]